MTGVKFFADGNTLFGFEVSGHSSADCDDEEGRLVCAAVSSAVYMAANTVTDIIGDTADIFEDDAHFVLKVSNPSKMTVAVLEGLRLHLTALSEQYSNNIKIYGGAKHVKD